MNFSAWLVGEKKRQKLTFRELAELTGIHPKTIQLIAAGRQPAMASAQALAASLGFCVWPTVGEVLEELDEYSKAELKALGLYDLRHDRKIANWATFANACEKINFQVEIRNV